MARARSRAVETGMPELNLTPMIDVVFQLIIFFMCAMKFKTLAMKLEMDLPRDRGMASSAQPCHDEIPVPVVLEQADSEGVPHLRIFGEEIRPDLGRGIGALPRTPEGGDAARLAEVNARHEEVWREHFAPKLAALADRLRTYRDRDPDLLYRLKASPRVRHAYVVGVLDTFVATGIERVDIRGTQGPAPGR